ncbi:MAG: hypothetical protein ACE149_07750 [Armatimonadota bacterium]
MQPDPSRSTSSALVLTAGVATAAVGLGLALGWEPGIPGEWVWRRNSLPFHAWLPFAIGLALTALAAALCRSGAWERTSRSRRILAFAALICVVFAFQVALLNAVGIPWVAPGVYIISPSVTTYYGVSLDVRSLPDWLMRYPELLPTLPYHAATHPPGLVTCFWLVRKLAAILPLPQSAVLDDLVGLGDTLGLSLTRSDALAAILSALLISLIGALGLIPIYLLARALTNAGAAIRAACLVGAMPGLVLLGASPDLIVMTLCAGALFRGYAGYRGSRLCAVIAGLVAAVGLFLSLAFALVVVWALLWAVVGIARSSDRGNALRAVARAAAFSIAGFAVFYLALYLLFGYRPIAVAVQALAAHRGVTEIETARTYWKWVLMNPVECALFAGLPLAIGALWSVPSLGAGFACPEPGRRGRSANGNAGFTSHAPHNSELASFLIAWITLFALLDLSGMVRGEVGRIWLFLLWPLAVAAGAALSRRADSGRATALLVFMQVCQALMMKGYLTIYSIL